MTSNLRANHRANLRTRPAIGPDAAGARLAALAAIDFNPASR